MIDFKSFEGGIRIAPSQLLTSDPLTGKVGQIYWNTTRNVLRICISITPTWQDLYIQLSTTNDATLRWDTALDRYTQNYDLLINSSTVYSASGITGLDITIQGGTSTGVSTDGAKVKLVGGTPGSGGIQGIIEIDAPRIKQIDNTTGKNLDIEAGDATVLGNPGGDLNLNAGQGIFNFTPGQPEISDVTLTADSNGSLINETIEWNTSGGNYYAWFDSTIPAVAEITEVEINSTGLTLQNTSFNVSSADGNDYYVWMNVDSLGSDPGGTGTAVEVQFQSTDPDTTISGNISTQLNLTGSFSVTTNIVPTRVIITDLTTGIVTDASDVDTGFIITTFLDGAAAISGSDPVIPFKTGIQVPFSLNDTANDIAIAFQSAIGSDANYSSSVLSDVVTITNVSNTSVADTVSSIFAINTVQQGVDDVSSGYDGDFYGYGNYVFLTANKDLSTSSDNTIITATEDINLISKNTIITTTEDIIFISDKIGIQAQHLTDPVTGSEGDFYYNTDSKRFRKYDGSSWGWLDISKNNGTIALIEAKDDALTALPTDTSTTVDGYTIQDGDYILFTNLTVGFDYVYKATVVITAITWAQVPYGLSYDGTPADGDLAYIKFGTINSDYLFSYTGTEWSIIGGGVLPNSDRNIAVLGGGTKVWDSSINTLSWSASAFIQVPTAAEARNEILFGSVVLANDGDVAVVTINRSAGIAATLTVSVTTILALDTSSPDNDNKLVIARRHNGEVFWGKGDGQRVSADSGVLSKKALIDNTAVPTLVFAVDADVMIVKYSVKRNINIEVGYMYITSDGINAGITTSGNEIGDTGVDFTVDVSGTDVRLLYTTTNLGFDAEIRYSIEKWDAS